MVSEACGGRPRHLTKAFWIVCKWAALQPFAIYITIAAAVIADQDSNTP